MTRHGKESYACKDHSYLDEVPLDELRSVLLRGRHEVGVEELDELLVVLLLVEASEPPVLLEDGSEGPPLILPQASHHHSRQILAQLTGHQHGVVRAVEQTLKTVLDDVLLHAALKRLMMIKGNAIDLLILGKPN